MKRIDTQVDWLRALAADHRAGLRLHRNAQNDADHLDAIAGEMEWVRKHVMGAQSFYIELPPTPRPFIGYPQTETAGSDPLGRESSEASGAPEPIGTRGGESKPHRCPVCNGRGFDWDRCRACDGKGIVWPPTQTRCVLCDGKGCIACKGLGAVRS